MNKVKGKIVDIQSADHLSMVHVDVEGDIFSSIVLEGKKTPLNYNVGEGVTLLFKETEVSIGKDLSGMISMRNRFPGVITKIDKGPVLAKITLSYNRHTIESIISTQSTNQMKLQEKESVEWLVKTNEVTLMKNPA